MVFIFQLDTGLAAINTSTAGDYAPSLDQLKTTTQGSNSMLKSMPYRQICRLIIGNATFKHILN